jgi:hypothetical protein
MPSKHAPLSLAEASMLLQREERIHADIARDAVKGLIAGVPAPEPTGELPLRFRSDVLRRWAGKYRGELREAGNAQ